MFKYLRGVGRIHIYLYQNKKFPLLQAQQSTEPRRPVLSLSRHGCAQPVPPFRVMRRHLSSLGIVMQDRLKLKLP